MDKNSSEQEKSGLSAKMALCLAAITLVGIDGEFKEEELEKLRTLVRDDEMAFLKAFEFYNSRPLETCMQVIAVKLTDAQKRATYSILNNLARADGAIGQPEELLLKNYAQKFEFTDKAISEILQSPYSENDLTHFD